MNSLSHAGFAGYALRAQLQDTQPRADGAVALSFDGSLRVLLHPAGRGDLVLEAQICSLPDTPARASELLEQAVVIAGSRPAGDADCLVLSRARAGLLLQQRVSADVSADQFEAGLGQFLNALVAWRAQLGSL